MMKTILLFVLLACAAAAFDSCSSSSSSTSEPKTPETTTAPARTSAFPYMIGRIEVIGNEPFTKIGLRVDQSHFFLLKAPKDLEQELTQHQSGLVKLYYSGRKESGKDHYLDVDHFEATESK